MNCNWGAPAASPFFGSIPPGRVARIASAMEALDFAELARDFSNPGEEEWDMEMMRDCASAVIHARDRGMGLIVYCS